MANLPPEIWRLIFRNATFVQDLVNATWDYDPNERIWDCWGSVEYRAPGAPQGYQSNQSVRTGSVEMATKLAIVAVCRKWRGIGVEYLYESIVIPTSMGNLGTLLEVVTTSHSDTTPGYGWWVKRIHICDKIVSIVRWHFDQLVAFMDHCPNLEIFSSPTDYSGMITYDDTRYRERLPRFLRSRYSLRRLDLFLTIYGGTGTINLAEMMPGVPLRSLGITVPQWYTDVDPQPSFGQITTLTLLFSSAIQRFPSEWTLPSLQNLALLQIDEYDMSLSMPFVTRHQKTITHLFLDIHTPADDVLFSLLACAPGLRSVAFSDVDLDVLCSLNGVELPGLTHLGICCPKGPWYISRTREGLGKALEKRCFPDIKTVRLLKEERSVGLTKVWKEMIELCSFHQVRLEDMYGRAFIKG